jgi:hypothetical protein
VWTGHSSGTRVKKQYWHIHLCHQHKSSKAQHSINVGHHIQIQVAIIHSTRRRYLDTSWKAVQLQIQPSKKREENCPFHGWWQLPYSGPHTHPSSHMCAHTHTHMCTHTNIKVLHLFPLHYIFPTIFCLSFFHFLVFLPSVWWAFAGVLLPLFFPLSSPSCITWFYFFFLIFQSL